MSFLFIAYSAHQRLSKTVSSRICLIDTVNISLAVVFNSLFLLWSAGCLIGCYFGDYKIFISPLLPPFKSLLSLEMILDILQRSMNFLSLSISSLQMSRVSDRDRLSSWSAICSSLCLIIFVFSSVLFFIFQGDLQWLLFYVCSAVFSACVFLLGIFSVVLMSRKSSAGIEGVISHLATIWNVRVCYFVILSGILDFVCKSVLILIEIGTITGNQLLVDMSVLFRLVSFMTSVVGVYTARIPSDKTYSQKG